MDSTAEFNEEKRLLISDKRSLSCLKIFKDLYPCVSTPNIPINPETAESMISAIPPTN